MDNLIITKDDDGVYHPEISKIVAKYFLTSMVVGAPGPNRAASNIQVPIDAGRFLTIQQTKALGSTTGWLVWPVSAHLCKYIIMQPDAFKNKRVLELGSGTGLVGLVCNIAECSTIILTDLKECLPICKLNLESNSDILNPHSRIFVEELVWGDRLRSKTLLESFGALDIIIGADIVYHQSPEVLGALVDSVIDLSGPETVFMLAYEYRECMIEDEIYFFAPLRTRFGLIEQVDLGTDRWLYIFSEFK